MNNILYHILSFKIDEGLFDFIGYCQHEYMSYSDSYLKSRVSFEDFLRTEYILYRENKNFFKKQIETWKKENML